MQNKLLVILAVVMLGVIIVLAWLLFATPTPGPVPAVTATTSPKATATTSDTTPPTPLAARVSISSPHSGATVAQTFDVEGQAPGQWYFEAQFPIQVRDANDNIVGRAVANAQGDWMTTNQVAFKTTVHIDASFRGPATLILLRDNPSGLPENDDSVTIPIVVE